MNKINLTGLVFTYNDIEYIITDLKHEYKSILLNDNIVYVIKKTDFYNLDNIEQITNYLKIFHLSDLNNSCINANYIDYNNDLSFYQKKINKLNSLSNTNNTIKVAERVDTYDTIISNIIPKVVRDILFFKLYPTVPDNVLMKYLNISEKDFNHIVLSKRLKKISNGTRYTKNEIDAILLLKSYKIPHKNIALLLNRTIEGIKSIIKKHK